MRVCRHFFCPQGGGASLVQQFPEIGVSAPSCHGIPDKALFFRHGLFVVRSVESLLRPQLKSEQTVHPPHPDAFCSVRAIAAEKAKHDAHAVLPCRAEQTIGEDALAFPVVVEVVEKRIRGVSLREAEKIESRLAINFEKILYRNSSVRAGSALAIDTKSRPVWRDTFLQSDREIRLSVFINPAVQIHWILPDPSMAIRQRVALKSATLTNGGPVTRGKAPCVGPGARLIGPEADHPALLAIVESRHCNMPAIGGGKNRLKRCFYKRVWVSRGTAEREFEQAIYRNVARLRSREYGRRSLIAMARDCRQREEAKRTNPQTDLASVTIRWLQICVPCIRGSV